MKFVVINSDAKVETSEYTILRFLNCEKNPDNGRWRTVLQVIGDPPKEEEKKSSLITAGEQPWVGLPASPSVLSTDV